ncbi:nucleotidyltransferase family protein [Oceanicola sp. S124]|uniref:nucleotidyltransferase family protein n=1 Tax=Oceanicola sp. S124 TaxID=1042378 RepID=UPI00025593E6|nr:nucleotidyltransferase family protein [Oceanicola sp. S124]
MRPPSRRFPSPSWAWPSGDLETLLIAAAGADPERALAAARDWFARCNIDDASFSENRLQLAVAARFGRALADLPEYPRLQGLQRMLWTKSRMAIREALPAFTAITAQGIPLMLVKGAARIARDPEAQKARVSHDIDILVPRNRGAEALGILTGTGWVASTGESATCLRARLDDLRSVNLFFGHFGDIDLHMQGFGAARPDPRLEAGIWETATRHDFFGVPVHLPGPEHWLAMTLDSSALDAHAHSDWLVDCAVLLAGTRIDAGRLLALLDQRGLNHQALIAFSFLARSLGHDLPFLAELQRQAARSGPVTRAAILLQAKPRSDWTPLSRTARGIAKQLHLLRLNRASRASGTAIPPVLRGSIRRLPSSMPRDARFTAEVELPCPRAALSVFRIELALPLAGLNRRYDFELNSDLGHGQRLRVRDILGRKGQHRLVFSGRLAFDRMPSRLWIEARPGKTVRSQDEAELLRYGAPAFSVLHFRAAPLSAPRSAISAR